MTPLLVVAGSALTLGAGTPLLLRRLRSLERWPALAARLRACTKAIWHTYGPTEASLYTACTQLPPGPQPAPVPVSSA